MISLYVTCKNKSEAERIAKALLKNRLIACANHWPIQSGYWWKGKLEKGKEFALLCKTTAKKRKAAEREILRVHSYSLPVIESWKAETGKEVKDWLEKETR